MEVYQGRKKRGKIKGFSKSLFYVPLHKNIFSGVAQALEIATK
jgi:hypothetical protein